METEIRSIQRTFDDLFTVAPRTVSPVPAETPIVPAAPLIREVKLIGQPFVSPIAKIPTNRTPLTPTCPVPK